MKNHLEMTQIRDNDIDWSPTNLLQMKIDGKQKLFSSELLVTNFMKLHWYLVVPCIPCSKIENWAAEHS